MCRKFVSSESDYLQRHDCHILIVDDDDRIRNLLKTYLSRHGFRVSMSANTQDARKLMTGLSFDLLVLDIMMPGEDGVSFTEYLRTRDTVPIILLTAKDAPQDRITGLKAGADDYLTKPFEPEELVLRIDAIFRRIGSTAPAAHIEFGPCAYDLGRKVLTKDGERIHLTTGETALLGLLARMAGTPVSRHALSEQISATTERAVDVQITRLRRKIEVNPTKPDYLLTVRGHGYRLLSDNDKTLS